MRSTKFHSMSDQFTTIGVKRQRRLRKIVKKHERKELLTFETASQMRDTTLDLNTFQRNARRFYATQLIGTRLVLSHPFTDVHGRYLKSVVLDFSMYEKDNYIHVQPFVPSKEANYGTTTVNYSFWLHAKSHRDLYLKLLKHELL